MKENAAWALGYIARHNANLAQSVVDTGALPLLVLCLQEPEITLRQIGASAVSDIAKHTVELAQSVVDAGAVPYLAKTLNNPDEKLKRQILSALSKLNYIIFIFCQFSLPKLKIKSFSNLLTFLIRFLSFLM